MTTNDTPGDGSISHPNTTSEGYEWTCPYCGKSQLNKSVGQSGKQNAIAALRTHVVASDGDEHGPRNELPPDESLRLSDHVRRVGGCQ